MRRDYKGHNKNNHKTTKRIFVGVFAPKEWGDKFGKYQKAFPAVRGMRWTPSKDLHLTLIFLGQFSKSKLPAVQAMVGEIASKHKAFDLEFDHFRQAPPHALAPNMIWAQFKQQGEFELLGHQIKRKFMSITVFDEEPKKIIPHITLARMKNMPVMENIDVNMKERNMHISKICLVEVSTGRDHPHYKILETYPLKKDEK